jgi:hypothetical protein
MSEKEVIATYRDHVSDEAFQPFMTLKDLEKSGEWKAYIRLCIDGEVTERSHRVEGAEVKILLGDPLQIPDSSFHEPLVGAVFFVQVRISHLLTFEHAQGRVTLKNTVTIFFPNRLQKKPKDVFWDSMLTNAGSKGKSLYQLLFWWTVNQKLAK